MVEKDSAMAFYELKRTNIYKISALITILTEDYDRISMHGVRRILNWEGKVVENFIC